VVSYYNRLSLRAQRSGARQSPRHDIRTISFWGDCRAPLRCARNDKCFLRQSKKESRPKATRCLPKLGRKTRLGAGWKRQKKRAKIAPLNHLPLLPSGPGGVQQELVVLTRRCKDRLRIQTDLMDGTDTALVAPGFACLLGSYWVKINFYRAYAAIKSWAGRADGTETGVLLHPLLPGLAGAATPD